MANQILHKQCSGTLQKVVPSGVDLVAIGSQVGHEVAAEDVFCCSMLLANDQYDRAHERFTEPMLQRFAETLVGKAFMTGHDYDQPPRGRFYDASVVKNGSGNALLAKAFVDARDEQAVRAISLGIWKDMSIGYQAGPRICDLDGKQWSPFGGDCSHWPGERDEDGQVCTLTYSQPEKAEAMEGSAVWLGCQYGAELTGDGKTASLAELKAGWMTKRAGINPARQEGGMKTVEELTKAVEESEQKAQALTEQLEAQKALAQDGETYRAHLRAEIGRKYGLCDMEATGGAILKALPPNTGAEALRAAEGEVQKMFDQRFPPQSQSKRAPQPEDRDQALGKFSDFLTGRH